MEILIAFLLFANPFGRFVVLATRSAGIELLGSINSPLWGVFVLFFIASTFSSFVCLLLFNKFAKYAERFKIAKKVIGLLEKFSKNISKLGGQVLLILLVGLLTLGTSPLYVVAACALAKIRVREALIGLVLGNLTSFTLLHYFGLAFGKDLMALMGAATIMTVLSFGVFYLMTKKNSK